MKRFVLAVAVADVASISERRTDRFLDRARNEGLPPFLADDPGVDSGLMIAQYTAAGIVSELKRLAVPASVDSIPSSAMQEDHVSMGWAAARKLRRAVDGLARVLAIELLTATRGTALLHTRHRGWIPWVGELPTRKGGAMVSDRAGTTTSYALDNLQQRGEMLVGPGEAVYEGMIIGENARSGDMVVNVVREKVLWPRSITGRNLGPADQRALADAIAREATLEHQRVTTIVG